MKHREDYIKLGYFCPFCRHEHIDGGFVETGAAVAKQTMTCNECGASWEDHYQLVNAVVVEEPVEAKK